MPEPEAIEVIARFDNNGWVQPLRIRSEGRVIPVDSTGRRWQDEAGMHILCMLPGGRVVELIFQPAELRWYLRRLGEGRRAA
jgi:hypothetical protein